MGVVEVEVEVEVEEGAGAIEVDMVAMVDTVVVDMADMRTTKDMIRVMDTIKDTLRVMETIRDIKVIFCVETACKNSFGTI